jgi:tetratricopeptide (TPR) repeat protein
VVVPDPSRPTATNQLTGTVHGPTVQAGTIHGDVHFHDAVPAGTPVPHQLPPAPAHFTGRDAELAELDGLLGTARPVLAVVSGPGGVGKTALALHWAHRMRDRFPDGQLYVDLAGFGGGPPLAPAAALGGFLRALGVPPARVPVDPDEQAALFRTLVADRSLLVLLDNADSAGQARELLPASPTSAVVVTSQHQLAGLAPAADRFIEVGPLTAAAAGALLARIVGRDRIDRERDRARELVERCAGLPIAVCLSAARLTARPRLSVGRLADEMADDSHRLSALSVPGDGSVRSVRAVFDASYLALDEPARRLYRTLAWHPGPDFGAGPAAALAATAAPAADLTAGKPLDRLAEARLVEEAEEDRFRFHDLVRLHARAITGDAEHRAALRTMLEWYLAAARVADRIVMPYREIRPYRPAAPPVGLPVIAGRDGAVWWLDRERVNLMAAGAAALDHGWPELCWHLSDVMWPLLLYRKYYRDRLEIDRRGVLAARAWGDGSAEADMLRHLGSVTTTIGDYRAAERQLRDSIQLSARLDDRPGGTTARELLGVLYLESGRSERAVGTFQRVLADRRASGTGREIGLVLINLGRALLELGRPAEALAPLREARAVLRAEGGSDPYNDTRALTSLARAHLDSGDPAAADRAATEAARSMRELGTETGEADALTVLGDVARHRGDHPTALRHYRNALLAYTSAGSTRAPQLQARIDNLTAEPPR